MARDSFEDLGFEETFDDLGFQLEGQSAPSVQPIEGVDKALALAQTAASGATLGFGDELAGLIGAGMQGVISPVVSGEVASKEDLLAAYKDVRDFARKRAGQLREESPVAATVADIGGSLVTGGALLKTTKLLPGAQTLSTAASKLPAEALLTKISKGAALGLPVGAAAGAGTSEADLTQGDVSGLATDIATGATLGAGVGAALPIVTAPLKSVGSAVTESEPIQNLIESFKMAKSGKKVLGPEALKQGQEELEQLARTSRKEMQQFGEQRAKEKRGILQDLESKGQKTPTGEDILAFEQQLDKPTIMRPEEKTFLEDFLQSQKQLGSEQSPIQLENSLKQAREKISSLQSSDARKILGDYRNALRTKQNELSSEIGNLNKQISSNIDLSESLLGRSEIDKTIGMKDTQDWLNKAADTYKRYFSDPAKTQLDFDKAINEGIVDDTGRKIPSLKEINPEFANWFEQNLKSTSKEFNLRKMAQEPLKLSSTNPFKSVMNLVTSGTIRLGAQAGEAVKNNKDFMQSATNILSASTPEHIQTIGNKLSSSVQKTSKEFGKILQTASEQPLQSRQAIIFSLMQQPAFRQAVQEEASDEFSFKETQKEE